ncbi:MAG: hypothetical protein PHT07_21430 [Paludibacter sp.]|nr:hypothetical protein [Paludibacter sp.]
MSTIVSSKRDLIAFLEKNIEEDKVVIYTDDFHGDALAASKRVSSIRLPFSFSGDAFKEPGGLSVAFKNPHFAILVVSRKELSEKANGILKSTSIP